VDSELLLRVVFLRAQRRRGCAGMGKNQNVDYRAVVASSDRVRADRETDQRKIRSCCSRSPVLGRG